jgi:hypothetical protein
MHVHNLFDQSPNTAISAASNPFAHSKDAKMNILVCLSFKTWQAYL